MKLTFDEYDAFIEKVSALRHRTFWPDIKDIDYMNKEPSKWLLFACSLLEFNEEPKDNAEKYSKTNLTRFVNKHLELVD